MYVYMPNLRYVSALCQHGLKNYRVLGTGKFVHPNTISTNYRRPPPLIRLLLYKWGETVDIPSHEIFFAFNSLRYEEGALRSSMTPF